MAQLDGAIPTTLGALVGAATFAAGFLSTRVHRQRDQALTIATQTDALADAAARAGEPIPPEVLRNQLRALDDAGNDRLDRLAGGSVVLLAGSAIVLVAATARTEAIAGSSDEGRLLIAFVVAALVVITVAMVDLVFSRRDVLRRRAASIGGLMERSVRLWAGVGEVTPDRWQESLSTATAAVRRSRGMYGPAWLVLGNTHLARLGMPLPPADTWLDARWALDRATTLGPESAGLRWARAYLIEVGPEPDWEECVREWVRGCWLHHEATRPLARTDEVVEGPDDRTHRSIAVDHDRMPAADTLRFRPREPVVFAGALGRIPPLTGVAGLTAQLLQQSVRHHPEVAASAADAAVAWLEDLRRRLGPENDVLVDQAARRLLAPEDPAGWRAVLERYVSEDGPLRRARRDAVAADVAREARSRTQAEETTRQLDAWLAAGDVPPTDDQRADASTGDSGDIDWDAEIRRHGQQVREFERWRREHEEWLDQEDERQAGHERESQNLRDSVERLERIRTGRATEVDLDESRTGADHPDAPWPEPRPRPGEPTGRSPS